MNDLDFSQPSEGEMVRLYAEYLYGTVATGLMQRVVVHGVTYILSGLIVEDISHFGMNSGSDPW